MKYPIKKILTLIVLLGTPLYMVGAQNPAWINYITDELLNTILPLVVSLLTAFALVYFVWGMVVFIVKAGNESAREDGKQQMIWGLIALFVIVCVWGLVALLQTIVGAGGKVTPTPPQTSFIILQDNYLLV